MTIKGQLPELIEVQKKLTSLKEEMVKVKKEAIDKYWTLHGKKVRLKETGDIFYARIHDIYVESHISSTVRYDLCKNETLKKKVLTVNADEIEKVE